MTQQWEVRLAFDRFAGGFPRRFREKLPRGLYEASPSS